MYASPRVHTLGTKIVAEKASKILACERFVREVSNVGSDKGGESLGSAHDAFKISQEIESLFICMKKRG